MKIRLILSITLLFLSGCTNSKQVTGYWVGLMEMNGKSVDISICLNPENNLFSSNGLMIHEWPASNLKLNDKDVSFSFIDDDVEITFKGIIEDENIHGTAEIRGMPPEMKISFNLARKSNSLPVKEYSIEKLAIKSKGANISAEIYKPKTNILHPALVLLHGSSGNLKNRFTFYANFFANLGFEVLIFDKRGNGESTGNNLTANYDDLAEDVIECLQTLENRQTIDKSKIGLWGISQGGMLLPFIASKTKIPSFLIAISAEVNGPAEAAAFADSIRIVNRGFTYNNGHTAAESHRKIGKMISNGCNYKEVETFINQNAQNYGFMNQTGLSGNISISKDDFTGLYWNGRKYNFEQYWKNLTIKTLALFGEDDDLVNPFKNDSIIKSINNNKIETKIFRRANHIMKKAFNPIKYPDFDWPRETDGYLDFVREWIDKEIKK
jgi:uncharacterized protein